MCKAATNIEKFGTALLHFNHENAIVQWICRALACDTGKANSCQSLVVMSVAPTVPTVQHKGKGRHDQHDNGSEILRYKFAGFGRLNRIDQPDNPEQY